MTFIFIQDFMTKIDEKRLFYYETYELFLFFS